MSDNNLSTVKFFKPDGAFSFEKSVSDITEEYCQKIKSTFFGAGGFCTVNNTKITDHIALYELCKAPLAVPSDKKTLSVLITVKQGNNTLDSWEATAADISPNAIIKRAVNNDFFYPGDTFSYLVQNIVTGATLLNADVSIEMYQLVANENHLIL